jgi:DNA-binding MarR family transcriptional regulator
MSRSTEVTTSAGTVAPRLRFSVARLARLLRQQDQSGYGPTLVAALSTIERHGPLTLGELAAREQVSPPTTTKVVEKLVDAGFVDRSVDADDRRVSRVSITPKGAKQLQTFRTRRTEWLTARLGELDDTDLERLAAALPVLEQLIDGEGPR